MKHLLRSVFVIRLDFLSLPDSECIVFSLQGFRMTFKKIICWEVVFWVFNATRYVQTKTQNARTRQFQEEFGVYVSKKLTEHWSWEDWLWSVDIYKICTNKKYKRNRQMFDTPKMFSSNVFAIFIILQNLTANKWRFQRKCVKLSCVKKTLEKEDS